jgi:hypothetical protein
MGGCASFDWDPIASASAYSALGAVLAGFVFTVIIVIITERARPARRIRTVRLFLSALPIFGFDSHLEALTAGEAVRLRARAVAVVASGLIGLGDVLSAITGWPGLVILVGGPLGLLAISELAARRRTEPTRHET